jgi:predicted MFS family arabinose efflux permease
MNPYKGLKNIPHNVWILAVATLINRSGSMVIPYLAVYMNKKIGVNASDAGMVFVFYGIGTLITSMVAGKLSDRIGELKVMRYSLLGGGALLFLYSFVSDYHLVLIITFVWAVISEAFRPANLSLLSFESRPEQRKTAFSLNRLAINLGMSIGPVVGGFLSQINYSFLFYVDAATSILAGVFLTVVKFEHRDTVDKPHNHQTKQAKRYGIFSILNDKRMLIYIIALTPICMVFFQFIGGLPLYIVSDLGYSESAFGMMMAVNTILIILVEVPLNSVMEKWDDKKALMLGGFLASVGFGLYGLSTAPSLIVTAIAVWTFGEMIFFPSSASYTAKLSPENKRGEYMGYYQMTFSISLMSGPWLGTILLQNYGSKVLWFTCFGFGLLSVFLFMWMKKKYHK